MNALTDCTGSNRSSPPDPPLIFLSHAEEDRRNAEEVLRALESHGVRCWVWWRDGRPGAPWDEDIVQAIESAAAIVLLVSHSTSASNEVRREIALAEDRQKRIVAFRIGAFGATRLSGW